MNKKKITLLGSIRRPNGARIRVYYLPDYINGESALRFREDTAAGPTTSVWTRPELINEGEGWPSIALAMLDDADRRRFSVTIRWGSRETILENQDAKSVYRFKTQGELDAFMRGVDEASGWSDYEKVEEDK